MVSYKIATSHTHTKSYHFIVFVKLSLDSSLGVDLDLLSEARQNDEADWCPGARLLSV
jgi:hypothetical protein